MSARPLGLSPGAGAATGLTRPLSATMPPTLVYDDDCGMCTRAALYVERHADVEIVGFADLSPALRDRLPDDYEDCAHLVADDAVYSCGEAMERAYELTGRTLSGAFPTFRRLPGYPWVRERGYRVIANNRSTVSKLVRAVS